jgi:hypothetical protein
LEGEEEELTRAAEMSHYALREEKKKEKDARRK